MPFVGIYDANALYPSTLRDLLIRVAQAGLVQARWTHQILDETFANLRKNRPELSAEALRRTRKLMISAIRDCLVTGYEPLIDTLDLPDLDDRHVLAAAIRARAQVIVTENLSDFPASVLSGWDIEAKNDFLDVGDLYEPPFTSVSPGGPERLFSDSAVDSIEEVLKGIKAPAVPVEPTAG